METAAVGSRPVISPAVRDFVERARIGQALLHEGAAATSPVSYCDRALVDILLLQSLLDPDTFRVASRTLDLPSDLGAAETLITVSCRASKVSRTYCSGENPFDWLLVFSQDLRAGVFTSAGSWLACQPFEECKRGAAPAHTVSLPPRLRT